jgi:hypothetical protein
MKKIIFGLMLITLVGCNQKKSTEENQNQNTENNSNSIENDSTNTNNDLPMSNCFEVKKINTMKYLNNGHFEMDFELVNNTDYKFSSVSLSAYISSRLKNSERNSITDVQAVDWKFFNLKDSEFLYNIVKKWQPHTSKHIHFICYASDGSFDRTPEEIELVLEASAISVDVEKEKGAFAKYNLLDLWKEKQVEKGVR